MVIAIGIIICIIIIAMIIDVIIAEIRKTDAFFIVLLGNVISNVYDFTHKNNRKPDISPKGSLEEFENEMLHLWVEGYLNQCKTQDDVLKFASNVYNKIHAT